MEFSTRCVGCGIAVQTLTPNLHLIRVLCVSAAERISILVYVCVHTCCMCGASPVRRAIQSPPEKICRISIFSGCRVQVRHRNSASDVKHGNKIKHPIYFQSKKKNPQYISPPIWQQQRCTPLSKETTSYQNYVKLNIYFKIYIFKLSISLEIM